jgi:oligoribonuclease NrnB/cAMP/cGMP phosphodiesterase (DHH superfamily)
MQIDVFNGDADGICALLQLRLAYPVSSQLITGVKRDIELLENVKVQNDDQVTVLDISLAKNSTELDRILADGAKVFYVDHHLAGAIPNHKNLTTIIDTRPGICTSLLVNDYLQGKFHEWAIVAAFGDNLNDVARESAYPLSLDENEIQQLKMLGICMNYNSYGASLADLNFAPDLLFKECLPYKSPFDFMTDNAEVYDSLLNSYSEDMAKTRQLTPEYSNSHIVVYSLPDEVWARRVNGVFGNDLANHDPQKAHAVISPNAKGGFQVNVRAPLNNPFGADELCSRFDSGGGRKAAAGINHLSKDELEGFIQAFEHQFQPH